MEFQSAIRPAARALSASRCSNTPFSATRGHKTLSRTKRALKIAPHDSFLPDRSAAFPAADSIIYNPPASEASSLNTPFRFLPPNDPRRRALMRGAGPLQNRAESASADSEGSLPPAMEYKRRNPQYHVGVEQIEEMRRLRNEDPLTWSTNALAAKFKCSPIFVSMAAPAPPEHIKWLKEKEERKKARWGPIKTRAMEDRKRRVEMVMRGEI